MPYIISISNHESIEALSISILISHQVIGSAILHSPSLDFQKSLEILEESHLLGIIFGVILDMLLVSLQVLHDALLLPQLGVEELGVTLELIRKPLLWLVDELCLVANPLQEGVIDLSLDVVVMVLPLIISVIVECRFDFRIHLALLLVQVHHNVIVLLLFFGVDCLNLLHLRTEVSQLLDFWRELLLSVFDFPFDLVNSLSDLLKSLILLVVKQLLLIGNALDLVLDLGVSLDSLLSLKILHELSKVLSSSLEDALGSRKNGDL